MVPHSHQQTFDDLVPNTAEPGVCGDGRSAPHQIEREVHCALMGVPGVRFTSLEIHRTADGICLDGFVETNSGDTDAICRTATMVSGIQNVLDRLIVKHRLDRLN